MDFTSKGEIWHPVRGLPRGHRGETPESSKDQVTTKGEASSEKPAPDLEGASNFKRRVRKAAWRWMGMQILPTGQAGSQPPPPSTWTKEVAQYMNHRHRGDQATRPQRGGAELLCLSWNVQTLQLGQLQESLRTAKAAGVHVVLLQSTRWTQPGPREVEGFAVHYSTLTPGNRRESLLRSASQDP